MLLAWNAHYVITHMCEKWRQHEFHVLLLKLNDVMLCTFWGECISHAQTQSMCAMCVCCLCVHIKAINFMFFRQFLDGVAYISANASIFLGPQVLRAVPNVFSIFMFSCVEQKNFLIYPIAKHLRIHQFSPANGWMLCWQIWNHLCACGDMN